LEIIYKLLIFYVSLPKISNNLCLICPKVPNMQAVANIVRALGFECVLRKKNGLDEAIEDIHAGRVKTMTSIDSFINRL